MHALVIPCASLPEVRTQIDRIDQQLLALLGERGAYVRQAARFKRDRAEVAAPQRVEEIISRLCLRAPEFGAEAVVVEATWRAMIAAFIAQEQREHEILQPPES